MDRQDNAKRKACNGRGYAGALIAALVVQSVLLTGCVSSGAKDNAAKDEASAESVLTPAEAEAAYANGDGQATVRDPRVVALGTQAQTADQMAQNAAYPPDANAQPESFTMQGTGLKATSNSIFSSGAPVGVAPAASPGGATPAGAETAPQPAVNGQGGVPFGKSLFHSNIQGNSAPMPLPLEGATNTVPADQAGPKMALAAGDTTTLPETGPIPASAATALTDESSKPSPAEKAIAETLSKKSAATQPTSGEKAPKDNPDPAESLALTGLFGAKRLGKARQKTTDAWPAEVASLGYATVSTGRPLSMFATVEDSDPDHDDRSKAIQVAALPGLARLAPNGLWLQTETVETGCFRPQLMDILKTVESHYGRKLVVTSGLRGVEHNRLVGGARNSLHTSCQAADVQLPGVSKWELARYLRTLPGRGGVGTYCHTESVHIDIGRERDWNWPCQRREA